MFQGMVWLEKGFLILHECLSHLLRLRLGLSHFTLRTTFTCNAQLAISKFLHLGIHSWPAVICITIADLHMQATT